MSTVYVGLATTIHLAVGLLLCRRTFTKEQVLKYEPYYCLCKDWLITLLVVYTRHQKNNVDEVYRPCYLM